MSGAELNQARPPSGFWAQRMEWQIESVHSSVQARTEARAAVAAAGESHHAAHPSGHVFASASERVAMAMGELTTNGLRHADPPVIASLSRGSRGWLLVVSDGSATRFPSAAGTEGPAAIGGLGLRLVMSMSLEIGWCLEHGRKLVWALVGDAPPQSLLTTLDRALTS